MVDGGLARESSMLRMVVGLVGYMPDAGLLPDGRSHVLKQTALTLWTGIVLAVNICTAWYAMSHVAAARSALSTWLHPSVMGALLTGVKPVRNLVSIAIFAMYASAHRRLFREMCRVSDSLSTSMASTIDWRRMCRMVLTAMATTFGVIMMARVAEMYYQWPYVREAASGDVAFFLSTALLAPMLSVWQLTPLFYFTFISFGLAAMFRNLRRHMKTCEYTSAEYFKWYMSVTELSDALTAFSTVYLFASLAISVVIVCLAVYYVIHVDVLTNVHVDSPVDDKLMAYAEAGWATLQVLVAIAYVLCITAGGQGVNESARSVLDAALTLPATTDEARFTLTRFMSRVQTQHPVWGVTIWRALPVERALLFTLFGLISTYAVVLLKLQSPANFLRQCDDNATTISM